MKTTFLLLTLAVGCALSCSAGTLVESTYTEIINDVSTLATDGAATPAKLAKVVKAPDRVRTGAQSRAELTAPDKTITRVGANTVFSYSDQGRTVNLEKGSLLFHTPKGLGGGTIKSGGAAAAVLGTTLMVTATPDGGFKVILLEGRGNVRLLNGRSVTLQAGQLVFVLPGGKGFSEVVFINLGKLVDGSQLIKGFTHELSSLPLIFAAIREQLARIDSGRLQDTGWTADVYLNPPTPANGLNALDHGSYGNALPAPSSAEQLYNLFGKPSGQQGAARGPSGGTSGRGLTVIGFPPG